MDDRPKDVMKQATKRKIKKQAISLTKELLMMLVKFPAGLAEVFILSDLNYRRLYYSRNVSDLQIKRAASDLRKQRLIQIKNHKGRAKFQITDLGRAKALKWAYGKKLKRARRDGLSTVIIFDIPEDKRKARNFLRRFLKENDFIQLQKSVFIGRFFLLPEFKQVLRELDIELNVSILEGRIVNQ